jgi:acyl-CoA synthetase (AMP-forming)/AMP-acid ligase II
MTVKMKLSPDPETPALHVVLERWAQEQPAVIAAVTPHGVRDYAGLSRDSRAVARSLHLAGVSAGDRVAVLARNDLAYLQLLYGASRAGAALVCLNWRLAAEEISVLLSDCTPRLVFCEPRFADLLPRGTATVSLADDGLATWLEGDVAGDGADVTYDAGSPALVPADQTVVIMYTTGTTATPKGVQLTQRNLWFMAEQAADAWAMHRGMRFLACLPFFHISGLSAVVSSIFTGARVVIPASLATADICRAVEQHRITHTVLVPTVLSDLVDDQQHRFRLDSLEVVIYGAAPAGSRLIERCMAMLPRAGFSQGYGLTETAAGVTAAPLQRHGDRDAHPGSAGVVLPRAECRIVDPDTGTDLGAGRIGEIWVRTPTLTPGYLNQPVATRAAITQDGWLRTGDLGELDEDGFLFIRDRLKDVIISGGENIYSLEVENAIRSHPSVREAAVVGVPHERWGESVKAVVTLLPGTTLTLDELTSWLEGRLARYKHPRQLQVLDAMPMSGSGKIVKRELRDG